MSLAASRLMVRLRPQSDQEELKYLLQQQREGGAVYLNRTRRN